MRSPVGLVAQVYRGLGSVLAARQRRRGLWGAWWHGSTWLGAAASAGPFAPCRRARPHPPAPLGRKLWRPVVYDYTEHDDLGGLLLCGVGSGTRINHVMVNTTLGCCHEVLGGTVKLEHVVCNNPSSGVLYGSLSFQGSVTNLFGRHGSASTYLSTGIHLRSPATVENATLCGLPKDSPNVPWAALYLETPAVSLEEVVATGFDAGLGLASKFPEYDEISFRETILFGMHKQMFIDYDPMESDPENWFDEQLAAGNISTNSPGFDLLDCLDSNGPSEVVTRIARGAFKDESDWHQGPWVSWETE
jgi:hypothetical protein